MSLLNLAKAYNKKLEKKKKEEVQFSAIEFFKARDKSFNYIDNSLYIENLSLWKSFDDSYTLIDLDTKELEIDISEMLKGI